MVLSANIQCDEKYFYDLDDRDNLHYLNDEFAQALQKIGANIHFQSGKEIHQRKNLACKFFAKKHNIKIFAFTFYQIIKFQESGFVYHIPKKQICVLDNTCISNIHYLKNEVNKDVTI